LNLFASDNAGEATETHATWQHHPRKHAARWTQHYVFNQLIPYLGNKRKLLPLVAEALAKTGRASRTGSRTFLDVFAGSGAVSRFAKTLGYSVLANDWEPYSFEINTAYITCNEPPAFRSLGGIEHAFDRLNDLPGVEGYIATYYCPRDDGAPDVRTERMFFTHANGARIDAMREQIEMWHVDGTISRVEKSVLLATLIYSASYVSNTSGVFKGFHNGWGGRNGTALYRILSDIRVEPPAFFTSNRASHCVYQEDAREVVRRPDLAVDVAYIDPPYNQHQYGSNYHLLNTIALWDCPPVDRSIRLSGRVHNKSAIRKDWRSRRRSRYCYRDSAPSEFADLIANVNAKWVLVSYGLDGIIPLEYLVRGLCAHGRLECVWRSYKRYRVSPTRPSPKPRTIETVFILEKGAGPSDCGRVYDELRRASEASQ